MRESVVKAHKAGVKLAFGTDAVVVEGDPLVDIRTLERPVAVSATDAPSAQPVLSRPGFA